MSTTEKKLELLGVPTVFGLQDFNVKVNIPEENVRNFAINWNIKMKRPQLVKTVKDEEEREEFIFSPVENVVSIYASYLGQTYLVWTANKEPRYIRRKFNNR